MTPVQYLVDKILVEQETYLNNEGDLTDESRTEYFNGYKSHVNLSKYVQEALEMEQNYTDNKAIHFAEWLTKKHTLTLIALYEQFEEQEYKTPTN